MHVLAETAKKDVPLDWWGHRNGFVWGGFLGTRSSKGKTLASRKSECSSTEPINVAAFAEQDQENLYKLVQVLALHFCFMPPISHRCEVYIYMCVCLCIISTEPIYGSCFC